MRSLRFSGVTAALALAISGPAGAAPSSKVGDSKAFEAAETRAASQPEPKPALWLLADEDTRIYMFGTIHVLPPGFRWRSAAFDKAVGESAELVIETYVAPDAATEAREPLAAAFLTDKPVPVLKRVPKKHRKALKKAIEASGVPMATLDGMHSWAAAVALGIAEILGEYGVEDVSAAPGVEDVLEVAFREAGKPIHSVEDGKAVLAEMSALPEKVQIALLLDAIAPMEGESEEPGADEAEWVAGRSEAFDIEREPGFSPELFDVLVRKRNAAWTLWLENRLKTPGTLLFAVGAGHLAGRESVQAMLERRGLKVTRVD